jgi:hypothetical protein
MSKFKVCPNIDKFSWLRPNESSSENILTPINSASKALAKKKAPNIKNNLRDLSFIEQL